MSKSILNSHTFLEHFSVFCVVSILLSCNPPETDTVMTPTVLMFQRIVPGDFYSLQLVDNQLHITYTDYHTASLYLDVVSDTDDYTNSFVDKTSLLSSVEARHVYTVHHDTQHAFYLDREDEDDYILKWIHKPLSEKQWMIDTVTPAGTVISTMTDTERKGEISLIWCTRDRLYVSSMPQTRLSTHEIPCSFDLHAHITRIHTPHRQGLLGYDEIRRGLIFVGWEDDTLHVRDIIAGGRIHYAVPDTDVSLKVLVYEPEHKRIDLYGITHTEDAPTRIPVTMSSGTQSVFFAILEDEYLFVFDEEVQETTQHSTEKLHQLSMLYPLHESSDTNDIRLSRYTRAEIFHSTDPIIDFRALLDDSVLYVLLHQKYTLKLLRIDVSSVIQNEREQAPISENLN